MGMSFDDKESFMEAAGSLRFNNLQSDPNTHPSQRVGTEDIGFNNRSNDPITTLQRMGSSSQEIREESR